MVGRSPPSSRKLRRTETKRNVLSTPHNPASQSPMPFQIVLLSAACRAKDLAFDIRHAPPHLVILSAPVFGGKDLAFDLRHAPPHPVILSAAFSTKDLVFDLEAFDLRTKRT